MRAEFEQKDENGVVVVLVPESNVERVLLGLWLRYDQNALSATVSRLGDKSIAQVALESSSAI